MKVLDTVIGKANKVFDILKPHLPMIGMVVGSAAVCAGGFITGRATLKVDSILDSHNEMMDHTRREINGYSEDKYSEFDRKRDVVQVYSVTANKFVRAFGPGIALSTVGFMCIFKSFTTLSHWHMLAVGAVTALDEQFSSYRGNVVNELGVEADKKFLLGEKYVDADPKTSKVELSTVDENGEVIKEEREVVTIEDPLVNVEDDFTRVFDYHNPKWDADFLMNDNFVWSIRSFYTKQLQQRHIDHVFLNTIFKDMGFEETGIGHFYGWTSKPGCSIDIDVTPYILVWDEADGEQFPMYIPFATVPRDDNPLNWVFVNEEDEVAFRQAYIEDETKVGFILKFNVDTDQNGVPKNIYNDVYNKLAVRK